MSPTPTTEDNGGWWAGCRAFITFEAYIAGKLDNTPFYTKTEKLMKFKIALYIESCVNA